ncbi:hypothetical protein Q1695_009413 [Nippostrongylus brasiliensis]|nr:hypothetical protein Q1695_009413 [Nippostrongylus brasiliensis]
MSDRCYLIDGDGSFHHCFKTTFSRTMSTTADLVRAQFSSQKVLDATKGSPIKAYLLPSTDAHQSEYLADHDFRVKFLTGFTGSNATVAVTTKSAVLWTDGRYFTQAMEQLMPPFTLLKESTAESISVEDFLASQLEVGDWLAIDPTLHTYDGGLRLTRTLEGMGFHVAPVRQNLVDEFWNNRPPLQSKGPIVLSEKEHGRCVKDKLKELRQRIAQKKCSSIILAALDDIMWLLNIRGFDIKHNPLAYSYLLVTPSEVHLFMDKDDDTVRGHLANEGVTLHPYAKAYEFMSSWHEKQKVDLKDKHRVFVPTSTNYLFGMLFAHSSISEGSPVQVMKGVKNPVELEGMRQSHIRDSAALVSFLMWVENELLEGRSYSEIEMAAKVDSMRAAVEKYMDLSFSTISAAGDHAAKPHYHSEGEEGKRQVTADQVYLVDSGAHYRDGTTDVTRTIWISSKSPVPKEFIQHNTLVLKGHINLANTVFPQAITGIRLDTLSRHALWQAGLDFGHGTGHGVGHYLNVHEGPASIGHRTAAYGSDCWVREGMVLTIEPGYYLVGKWGIRIENCYEVVKAKVPSGADFLGFRALTLAPIQTDLIDKSLLTETEVEWLNSYHDQVLFTVGGYLEKNGKAAELKWLEEQCAHI